MSPSDAWKKLMAGNRIFASSMARRTQTIQEREALGSGQAPVRDDSVVRRLANDSGDHL